MKGKWLELVAALALMLGATVVFVLLEYGGAIGEHITRKHFSTNYKYYKK